MIAERDSVPGLLTELEKSIPLSKNAIGPLFTDLKRSVMPVLNLGPGPIAAETIETAVLFNQVTLAGAETNFEFLTDRTQSGNVNRYHGVSFFHDGALARTLRLRANYLNSASEFDLVIATPAIAPNLQANLLGNSLKGATEQINYNGSFIDIFPGGRLELVNITNGAAGENYRLTLFRQILQGPRPGAPNIRSTQLTATVS